MYKKEEFSAPEILLFFEENYRDIHGRKKKEQKPEPKVQAEAGKENVPENDQNLFDEHLSG